MDPRYQIHDPSKIYSPALLFYPQLILQNLRRMLAIAGSPERLRPHAKTHKTREITRMALDLGITKHKCATLAEAEMLAQVGVPDILLAYPMVGPNCTRLARLVQKYPLSRFSVLIDDMASAEQLSAAMTAAEQTVEVLVDLDVGQHRTGVPVGLAAESLYAKVARLPGLRPGGFQAYDGHHHQESLDERCHAVEQVIEQLLELRDSLEKKGLPVPRLVAGGTPTFPVWANKNLPGLECSPGTCVLHDHGYGSRFSDLDMTPAALLLTRVVSRPTPSRVTLDLGTKALASDPPAGSRCLVLDLPEAKAVAHNEEHLVLETPAAHRFRPGEVVYAMPTHICPTCALHRYANIIENGALIGRWEIVARDRVLTV